MNNHQRRQARQHWLGRKKQAQERLDAVDKEYKTTNADYPIGAVVTVEDYGKITTARIKDYSISNEGILTPIFESLEGKCVFSDRPTIIKQKPDGKGFVMIHKTQQ